VSDRGKVVSDVMCRSAENNCSELLRAKNQLALDLERLLSHKEVPAHCLFAYCARRAVHLFCC